MRADDRERIQVEVVSRIAERYVKRAQEKPEGYLETLINDTIYHERRRLERGGGKGEGAFYDKILKRMHHASERELRELLEELAQRFVSEVVGNFDERVYSVTTHALPAGLWLLLNAMSPQRLLSLEGFKRGLADHLRIEGEVEQVKALLRRGTLVVVPTHSSNLDSILVGYGAYLMGIPPLTYGAGLNLFTNPLVSYFMNNLGAYKVDRKKSAVLYKEVLKEYATCSLEMGYSNLFFPGGTRSRSGAVEQKLKKGLLGAALRAYTNNLIAGRPRPEIYICPLTISYMLTLEAETLIGDHLTETGKARYIIEDDEFSKPRLVYNFMRNLISLDATIVLTFSRPLDVFGHQVDLEGRSLDARGRPVDPRRFLTRGGQPVVDDQRDMQYTQETADEICKAFMRDNHVMSTHLLAHALMGLLRRQNPALDIYRLLHTGGAQSSFPMEEVHREVANTVRELQARADGPRLSPTLAQGDPQPIVSEALRAFAIYHNKAAAVRRGDRVFHEDRNLLLYYANRLKGYNLRP